MKIDLHCHTQEIKIGDKGRAIDAGTFSQKLQAAGVSIAAITNHNVFDIDQYREFAQEVGSSIMVWPGVELDIRGHYGDEESFGHITVIVDPANAEELAAIITRKCTGDLNQFRMDIDELDDCASKSEHPASISSTCTVFAESEVISQLANGVARPDLVAGICASVASRVSALARRAGVVPKVCMSGGVAKNGAVRRALAKDLDTDIDFDPMAQYFGAIGAALYGYRQLTK